MKTFITQVLILMNLLCYSFMAQIDWAPVGARWHYVGSGFGIQTYYLIESIKDTIIQGHLCKKLYSNQFSFLLVGPGGFNTGVSNQVVDYTYKSNDTIYLYNIEDNHFYPVFVNNLNVGDTMNVIWYFQDHGYCVDKFLVTSVTTIMWDTIPIRQITLDHCFVFWENISGSSMLTPISIRKSCPPPYVYCGAVPYIRCYEHPIYGLYKFSNEPCDTVTSINQLDNSNLEFYVVLNVLYLKGVSVNDLPLNINIHDVTGRKIFSQTIHQPINEMVLQSIYDGVYIVEVKNQHHIQRKKIYFKN